MKLNVETPENIIDLSALERSDLHEVTQIDQGIRIGALVTMAEAAVHTLISPNFPVVVQSLRDAASQQKRNMATMGGNLLQRTRCPYFRDISYRQCNKRTPGSGCSAREGINRMHAILGTSDDCVATYPGDFAQALIALDGQLEVESRDGRRKMPFSELHRPVSDGPHRETTLGDMELITAIILPPDDYRRSLYLKVRDRASYEFAAASAAVALTLGEDNRVTAARIALGGVAYLPWRA